MSEISVGAGILGSVIFLVFIALALLSIHCWKESNIGTGTAIAVTMLTIATVYAFIGAVGIASY